MSETSLALVAEECGDTHDVEQLLAKIEPNDVVTSAKQGSAFIRRVTSTRCGGRHLSVERAHLGHVADANAWDSSHLEQLGDQLSAKIKDREFPLLPTNFGAPVYADENFKVWVANEHFRFEPDFEFDFERHGVVPTYFKMQAGGTFSAGATLKVKAHNEVSDLDEKLEESLFEHPIYESEPMYEVVVVDGVPVATVTKVGIYISAAAGGDFDAEATAEIGFNRDEGEFLVGPVYDGGSWSLPTPDFEAIEPYIRNVTVKAHGDLAFRARLRGSVTVDLYDLVGPELSLLPYAELTLTGNVDNTTEPEVDYHYTIAGGLRGSIGIDLSKPLAWLGHWLGNALNDPWEFPLGQEVILVDGGTPTVDVDGSDEESEG